MNMIRLIDGLKNAFPEVEISVMELLKASRMPLLYFHAVGLKKSRRISYPGVSL